MISLMEFVSICGVATMTAAGASQGLHLIRRSRGHRTDRPGSQAHEEASGRPPAGAWHEPRYGKRRAVSCGIEYVIDQVHHQGRLLDMSPDGWRAQGASPVPRDTAMQVRILCSESGQCIVIEEAVVRWTDGVEFGVEVTRISPESAARLSDYLIRQYPPEAPTPAYELSPFSYN